MFPTIILLIANLLLSPINSEPLNDDKTKIEKWIAGETVSIRSIEESKLANYFQEEHISDDIFKRIEGKSFKKGCTISRDSLRYLKLLHYDSSGNIRLGELICNKAISSKLLIIFQKLYEAKYPIERMVLIDNYDADDEKSMNANNTSAFNFRYISGTNKLSNHSYGLAIDINPLYNPYVKITSDKEIIVSPQTGLPYIDRSLDFPYKIDAMDLCCRLFKEYGFEWGGDWITIKDYQHFELIQ